MTTFQKNMFYTWIVGIALFVISYFILFHIDGLGVYYRIAGILIGIGAFVVIWAFSFFFYSKEIHMDNPNPRAVKRLFIILGTILIIISSALIVMATLDKSLNHTAFAYLAMGIWYIHFAFKKNKKSKWPL